MFGYRPMVLQQRRQRATVPQKHLTNEVLRQMGFGFDNIWIIQSLRPCDTNTGRLLYNTLLQLPGVESEHILLETPASASEYLTTLSKIENHVVATGKRPLLHIEVHGDQGGIQLSSHEYLSWDSEHREIIKRINVASRNNTLVALAACYGDNLVSIVKPAERCPMWGCIGPVGEIWPGELVAGFTAFYRELLASSNLTPALLDLNQVAALHGRAFTFWPAEHFFLLAFREYLRRECTAEKMDERLDYIINELTLAGAVPSEGVSLRMREEIMNRLRDRQTQFDRNKRRFFMQDLYLENEQRFSLQLSAVEANLQT
jgi:hypothetical protein